MSLATDLFKAMEAAMSLNLFQSTTEEELLEFLFLLDDQDPTEEYIRQYLEESSEREELRKGFEDFLKDWSSNQPT